MSPVWRFEEGDSMAENPVEADAPRTRDVTRTYDNDRIRVFSDAARWMDPAICLRILPRGFDVVSRPWIDLDGAEPEEIPAWVRKCPTGDLAYVGETGKDGVTAKPNTVVVRHHGPLCIRGRVRIK